MKRFFLISVLSLSIAALPAATPERHAPAPDSLTATPAPAADEAPADEAEPRFTYGLSFITEGQWNIKERHTAWANLLAAEAGAALWRGARLELGAIATYTTGDAQVECLQDFSNINAGNRAFRLTHAGLSQRLGNLTLFAGLRQADEDYWNTPLAGTFLGASYGCLPTVNDNYGLNVYPLAALGLHAEWAITPRLTAKTSLYNAVASDRLDEQFRFRARRDGVLNLGSIVFSRPACGWGIGATADNSAGNECPPATYLIGYNLGNAPAADGRGRKTSFGLWLTAEQPLVSAGRTTLSATATLAHQFSGAFEVEDYWNAGLIISGISPLNLTLGAGLSRAYYAEARETDLDVNILIPVCRYFSIQPAVHFLRTSGRSNAAANLRLCFEL